MIKVIDLFKHNKLHSYFKLLESTVYIYLSKTYYANRKKKEKHMFQNIQKHRTSLGNWKKNIKIDPAQLGPQEWIRKVAAAFFDARMYWELIVFQAAATVLCVF